MELKSVNVQSRDYWVKVVDFLQQNWALIDKLPDGTFNVFFFGDTSGIFDSLKFHSLSEATEGLYRNGFNRYMEENEDFRNFIARPEPPFLEVNQSNNDIYSSGRFWN